MILFSISLSTWLWVVGIGIVVALAVFGRAKPPPYVYDPSEPVEYNLTHIFAPRLTGRLVHLFAFLTSTWLGPALILKKVLSDANVPLLNRICVQREPTFHPLVRVPHEEKEAAATAAAATDLVEFVSNYETDATGYRRFTVQDYACAYRDGTITPLEVAKRILKAIESSNAREPAMRAVILSHKGDVIRQAAASTERHKSGNPLGILDGVPVSAKDEFDVAGYETYQGTNGVNHFGSPVPAKTDAGLIRRIKEAGGVIFAKTLMYELGINPTSLNAHWGFARNPYNVDHQCGGSSSGAGGCIAMGLGPIALGADGGGSVRVPASFCGAVGIKPTHGRITQAQDGVVGVAYTTDVFGVLGGTVLDCAIGYSVAGGKDANDHHTLLQPPVHLSAFVEKRPLSEFTIGIWDPYFDDCDEDVRTVCRAAVDQLAELGAKVVQLPIPLLEEMRVAHSVKILSEIAGSVNAQKETPTLFRQFQPDVRSLLNAANCVSSKDYQVACKVTTLAMEVTETLFQSVDAIVTPSTACTAPRIHADALSAGESNITSLGNIMRYVFQANLTGIPAITVPCGWDSGGLPVGLQFQASWWQEDVLFRLAEAVEENVFEGRAPDVSYNILNM